MNRHPSHNPNGPSLQDGDRLAGSHPGDALRFEPLEGRMLFSAAPSDAPEAPAEAPQEPELVLEIADKPEIEAAESGSNADWVTLPEADTDAAPAPEEAISGEINGAFAGEAWEPRPEIVFISSDIASPDELASMLDPRLEVVFLDANSDGVSQMAATLSGRSGIEAIHLVTHGSSGALHLGNITLDATTLPSDYADEMAVIAAALSSEADILIYGCDFASGESGQAAAGLIASMTGADVAASTDTTGGSQLGGDWDLELQTGTIEATALSAEAYSATLAPPVWSISGSNSVTEGGTASYTVALTGPVTSGQTAAVNLGVTNLSTTSGDYGAFVTAVNTAITGRTDLAFDGTTLTYTAPLVYTATHNTTSSGFNNISGTGTRFSLSDDSSTTSSIGFTFNFYGTNYTQVRVGSNGFLTFGGGSTVYTNADFSTGNTISSRPAIAPLWDDWDPGSTASDDMYVQTIGTAGNRQYIVQWNSIVHYGGSNPVTFQVVLFEADGSIEFRYQDVVAESGWENGLSATIGVSDGSTRYSQFSFNTASIGNNQSITYKREATMAPITINLPTNNDTTPESTETFRVSLTSPANSTLGTSQINTNIVDNDPAAPVGVTDNFSISESNGATSLGNALANDTDPNLDTLTATPASGSGSNGGLYSIASNGDVTFNPNGAFESLAAGETATTSFNYTVNDGNGGSATGQVIVTVNGQNDAPTALGTVTTQAGNDAQTITPLDLSGFFTDVDASDALTFSAGGTLPPGLSIHPTTGIVSGTIAANASVGAPYSVVITADDGNGGTITQSFTWNVTNPAPTANDDNFTADENDASTVIGNALTNLAGLDTDPDGDTLAATVQTNVAGSNGGLFSIAANGDVTFNPNGAFESLAVGETTTTSFTYQISDGQGGTDTATVTVTVTGENDAPTAIGTITTQAGNDAQTITPLDLSGFFTDVDASDALTFSAGGTLPPGLSIHPTTGIVSGTIAANASVGAPYSVVITANDGNGGSITQSFTWNITNPAPTATDDSFAADENDAAAVIGNALTNLAGLDTDPDGDAFSATVQTNVAGSNGGLFSIAANGDVTFNPNGAFESLAVGETATTSFTYQISDGQGGTDSATVTVTVTGENDTPSAIGTVTTQAGQDSQTITPLNLSGYFTDVDASDALTFADGGTLPQGLSIHPTTGVVSGTIAANASVSAPYTVVITADDGNGGTITQSFTWNVTNPAPTANDDSFSADENDAAAVIGNALTNLAGLDTDPDGDTLTADLQSNVAGSNGGLFSIAANGDVTFNPNGAFETLAVGETATTSFTYTVRDGQGGVDTATVTVTVTGENDAPTAIGTVTTQAGNDAQTITPLDLSGYFTDVDASDALTFSAGGTLPPGLSIHPNTGIVSGTLAANASVGSPYSVVITANDGNGGTVTQSFTWNVTNPAPTANDDSFSADENDAAAVIGNAITNLAGLDSDPDGDTLSATIQTNVAGSNGGLFSIAANGDVTFNPNGAFETLAVGETTTTSFTYQISDGQGGTDTATVTVTVTGENDVPTALGTVTTQAGQDTQTITPLDLSGFFTDVDASDTLTFSAGGTLPPGLSIHPTTGVVSGTIAANASVGAPYIVVITADDGNGGTVTQSFTWNVTNPAPTANDDSFSADENDAAAVVGNALTSFTGLDSDPDGDSLSATVQTNVAGSNGGLFSIAANGDVTFNPNGAFESLAVGETATTSFTYQISDGQGGTDTATVTVTVTGENDAPTTLGTVTTQAGSDAQTITPLDLSGFFTDIDANDTLTFSDGGTLPPGLSIHPNTGIVSGTIDPSASTSAPYSVVITANDGNGGTVTQSFTWNITNPAPTANDDSFAADENDAAAVIGNALTNLAGLDTDPDGDTLAAVVQTNVAGSNGGLFSIAANGDVTFNPNGAFESLAVGETTTTSFTYQISDGQGGTDTATVTVTVTGENDTPTAIGTVTTQAGNDAQTITPLDLSGYFTDVDASDALTFSAGGTLPPGLSIHPTTGVVSGTIAANASVSAPYTVVITANDGNGGSVTQSFTWNVSNPAPTANDDSFTADENDAAAVIGNAITNVTGLDTDPDGDPLTADLQSNVAGSNGGLFSIAANGDVTFNPNGAFESLAVGETATTSFTYQISDGQGGTDTATVTVTVTGENDAPTAIGTVTTQAGQDAQTITPLDLSGYFTDVDASDTLTFADGGTLPPGLSIHPTTGIVSGTLAANASVGAPYIVVITADDGNGGTVTQSFTWNITNPAPTANDDGFSADENDASAVIGNAITNLAGLDTDPEGDPLAAVFQTDIAGSNGGLFSIAANGDVTFNPNGAFESLAVGETATTSFTYQISDGQGGTDTATVTVTVTGENDAPTAIGTVSTQASNDTQAITPLDLSGFFTDVDASDTLTFADGGTLPPGLSIHPATGIVSGTIAANASTGAPYSVVITANDGNGGTVTQSFTWNITNPAPTANDDSFSADENDAAAVIGNAITNVAGLDSDPDGDSLAATVQTNVPGSNGGLFSIAANGDVTFNPNGAFESLAVGETATTSFTYQISDGQGGTDTATVAVTVTGENDAPTAIGTIITQAGNDAQTITPLDLSGFFSDVDASDALTFSAGGTLPPGLSIHPTTGVVSGTIDPSASTGAPYSVVITADDGNGGTITQSFTWNVTNPAPTANDDSFTADENDAAAVIGNAITNLAGLDSDPDGDTLTADLQTNVAGSNGGLFSIAANGDVTFNPNGDFESLAVGETATTSFTYQISDGQGGTDSATVTVTVTGENDTPTAIGTVTTQAGNDAQTITPLDLSSFFTDIDASDALTFSAGGTLPPGLSIHPTTGVVSGTIAANASVSAPYSVVITANDGNGGSITQSFTWNVSNPAPTANDDSFTADENDAAAVIGNAITNLAGLDSDPDGDTLSATIQTNVAGSNGGLFSIAANGDVTFNPNGDFESLAVGETATTSFTYQISDGQGGTDSATVTVTVTGENDAPTAIGTITTQAGNDAQTITPIDLSGYFTDVDASDALTFSAGGTLPPGLSIHPTTGIVSGTIAANASVGAPYNVVITANDGNGGSVTQSFTWIVTNPTPTANDDSFSADENDAAAVIGNAITNLAGLDTDPDGDPLAAVVQTNVAGSNGGLFSIAANGEVTFNPNGAFESLAVGETATTSFTYQISDGQGGTDTGTVTVTVTGENDAPTAIGTVTTQAGQDAQTITPLDLSGYFTDVDASDTLTFADGGTLPPGLSIHPTTGIVSGTIAANASVGAPYSVVITANDGNGGSITQTFTWIVTNPTPTATDDSFAADENDGAAVIGNALTNLAGLDTDPDGDTLAAVVQTNVAGSNGGLFSIAANGDVTFNPNGAFESLAVGETATTSFTYQISDGQGGTDTGTVTVTVTGENDAPQADDSAISVDEESTDTPLGLTAPVDIDGDSLIITVASLPSVGAVTLADGTPVFVGMVLSFSDLTGLLYDAPTEVTSVVTTAFTYTVTDSIAPAVTGTTTITVNPTNDAPIAAHDSFVTDEDNSVTIDVLGNDSDIENDPLTISHVDGLTISDGGPAVAVAHGSVQLSGGVLIFTPAPDYHGPISFTYTVSDGVRTAIATVTGTVNEVAEAITLSNATAAEDGTLTFTATLSTAAAGPFTVQISVVSGTATAGVDIPATPVTLTFDGTAGEVVSFTLTPIDDGLIENNETFTLVMTHVSNAVVDITSVGTGTITDNDAAPTPTTPGTGVTTDIELAVNGLGTVDLVIEDVETESALGFGSDADDADSNDNLSITLDGTDLVIRDTGGLWLASPIIGATRTANNEIRVPVSMITGSIILRTGVGDDTITLGNLGATLAGGLIIDTEDSSGQFNDFDTITYNSSTTLADGFDAEFRADTITAQANSSLTATGTGSVDWIAGRNIVMQNGADVITEDGDITFEANLPGVRTGNFAGIALSGATVQSSTGDISLDGRGGTQDHYNDGVRIGLDRTSRTGSTITTGGVITIDGTGGTAGSQSNGVSIGASSVTGASLTLNGTGGAAGGLSRGLYLYDADLAATSGDLTVHGTGRGGAATSSNFGVATHAGTTMTAAGTGAIDIRGTGGAGTGGLNTGVSLGDATAISVVDGDLTIAGTGGTGGSATSNQNRGTVLDRTTLRSTGAGDIIIDGTGNGLGIRHIGVAVGDSTIQATGTGSIDIAGTGSAIGGTMNHGLTVADSTVQTAGGSIDLTGTGGGTDGKNDGIEITGGSSIRVTTGAGSLTIAGTAGDGESDNVGTVINAATLSTVDGDLSITGTGQGTRDRNRGIFGTKVTATTTGSGSLTIAGTGSTTSAGKSNEGVTLVSSSTRATGTGNLTITGHGGRGNGGNHGILINATTATSAAGTTSLTGVGHASTTGNNNSGISLLKSSRVEGATLSLTGTGGGGGSKNYGLSIIGGTARATGGSLTLIGQARSTTTGTANFGVWIENKVTLSATGAFDIIGTGGGGTASNHGVFMNKGITAAGASVSGTVGAGAKSEATYGNYFA